MLAPLAAAAAVGAALGASPSCAVNGTACPPPTWAPTWNLTLSTVCQPGEMADYFVPPENQPWGLVSLDWSVANGVWHHANQSESTVEATSIEGCRKIKAVSPSTKCFIYHNMVGGGGGGGGEGGGQAVVRRPRAPPPISTCSPLFL